MTSKMTTAGRAPVSGSGVRRFAVMAAPAAIVTASLFLAMQEVIKVDDFEPPKQTVYEIEAYVAQTKPIERPVRPKPIEIRPATPPPRPPALVKSVAEIGAPISGYTGVAPATYDPGEINIIKPRNAMAAIDRTFQPMTPPVPVYPRRAIGQGLEGHCDVHLSVSPRGEPYNVQARCSHAMFERAARIAVQKVKFAPKIRDGLPVTVTGVVYPLEFRLEP